MRKREWEIEALCLAACFIRYPKLKRNMKNPECTSAKRAPFDDKLWLLTFSLPSSQNVGNMHFERHIVTRCPHSWQTELFVLISVEHTALESDTRCLWQSLTFLCLESTSFNKRRVPETENQKQTLKAVYFRCAPEASCFCTENNVSALSFIRSFRRPARTGTKWLSHPPIFSFCRPLHFASDGRCLSFPAPSRNMA